VRGEGLYSDFDSAADLIILKKYLDEFAVIKRLSSFSYEISKQLNCKRMLGTRNKPKDERRQFAMKDHRPFYESINK